MTGWLTRATRVFRTPITLDLHDHPDTQENLMPPAVRNSDDRIAKLRVALAEIDDESAADPVAAALDLQAWQSREEKRNVRRMQLAQELQRREQFGDLADDADVLAAMASYTSRVAEERTKLAPLTRDRAWPSGGNDGRAVSRLEKWWQVLLEIERTLPNHPAADRWIEEQVTAWFAARDAVLIARAVHDGVDMPQPELRTLPRGLQYGVHRGGEG